MKIRIRFKESEKAYKIRIILLWIALIISTYFNCVSGVPKEAWLWWLK